MTPLLTPPSAQHAETTRNREQRKRLIQADFATYSNAQKPMSADCGSEGRGFEPRRSPPHFPHRQAKRLEADATCEVGEGARVPCGTPLSPCRVVWRNEPLTRQRDGRISTVIDRGIALDHSFRVGAAPVPWLGGASCRVLHSIPFLPTVNGGTEVLSNHSRSSLSSSSSNWRPAPEPSL